MPCAGATLALVASGILRRCSNWQRLVLELSLPRSSFGGQDAVRADIASRRSYPPASVALLRPEAALSDPGKTGITSRWSYLCLSHTSWFEGALFDEDRFVNASRWSHPCTGHTLWPQAALSRAPWIGIALCWSYPCLGCTSRWEAALSDETLLDNASRWSYLCLSLPLTTTGGTLRRSSNW